MFGLYTKAASDRVYTVIITVVTILSKLVLTPLKQLTEYLCIALVVSRLLTVASSGG